MWLQFSQLPVGTNRILNAPFRVAGAQDIIAHKRKLFGTSGAVIFYDLTNTHMTGRPASRLARFERSRQKRNDCPLVTLALATDEGGFPRRSSVLPGNVSEPGTLLDALDSLATQDEGEDKPTVIMDAGSPPRTILSSCANRVITGSPSSGAGSNRIRRTV